MQRCCFTFILSVGFITGHLIDGTQLAYPMKFITTRCKIVCAKMKSANPRSGEIPANCNLFSGFACKRRQTTTVTAHWIEKVSVSVLSMWLNDDHSVLTAQNETTDGRNEAGQEWIERESSNETAIHKLCDTGEYDVQQISVDQFQFFRRIIHIFVVKFGEHRFQIRHVYCLLGMRFCCLRKNEADTILMRVYDERRVDHNTFKWNCWGLTLDEM